MPETKNSLNEPESNLNDTIELVLGIVRRRRWWILGAGCLIPLAVVAVAMKLPDRYVSQATLLVVQQQVSQRYVETDSAPSIPAAVQAMELEVLSRGGLLRIIHDLGLYTDLKDSSPEQLVGRMRKDIDVQPLESSPGRNDFNGFTISFSAATPPLAQEVASRLTSLFIEQNLKTQGDRAASTAKFLSDQLDGAKQRLTEQEQRLEAFKASNLGELPEDQAANLSALTDVRERLETVAGSLAQAQQQQASLQSPLEERLSRLQSEKEELLNRYTPRYPGVIKKDGEIKKVQSALDRLSGAPSAKTTHDTDSVDDAALAGILRQADTIAAAIESLTEQQKKLRTESEQYQKRLNLAPVREQQLAEILRDYDLFKQDYANLQKERLQAQLTNSLEENQEGQQFRLVDPPTLPVTPSSPKRLKICLGGMAGGIVLGLALAFLMDVRKGSFYSVKALSRSFSLPVVLGVPLVLTRHERRLRVCRLAFEWVAGCAMTVAMLTAEFYIYRNG